MQPWAQRKRLRLEDFDYADPGHVFFATLCARHHRSPFANGPLAGEVVDALNWSRRAGRWLVYCYCLMPDHLHLALSPGPAGWKLSESFRAFKRWTARCSWAEGLHGKLWQRGWYDHIARREEDLAAIMTYVLCNPVRGGLVERAEDWPYSGYLDSLDL